MIGTKYLSEAVHSEEFAPNTLNIVPSPVGSGKTHWAVNVLAKTASAPHKMVYLIDTVNGKEQLLKNELTQHYTDEWFQETGFDFIDEDWIVPNKIVVMTYAKFGMLAHRDPRFGFRFELIICDEIHNLPRFSSFINRDPTAPECHKYAKERLESIINHSKAMVIGLSATPRRAIEQMKCKTKLIAVDEDVRRFETKNTIPYTNRERLLENISLDMRGIIYISQVTPMKEFVSTVSEQGYKAIAIWSVNNDDHKMNEEQMRVRQFILDNAELSPEYNLFVINASSETSINIFTPMDFIIIHTREEETQVQVRGRFRGDLENLYVLDYNAEPEMPPEFLDIPLFKEDKKQLCDVLMIRNENGNIMGWTTAKKRLAEVGYDIKEGRRDNRRYVVITD